MLQNSSNSNIVQFFQLPLSLRSIALTPSGMICFIKFMDFWTLLVCLSHAKSHVFLCAICPGVLPASCQRSIFILSTSMLAFTGKVCHITELSDLLRCFTFPKVSSSAENSNMSFHTKHFMLYLSFIFFSRTRRRTARRCINRKKERSKIQCRIHGLG